MKKKIKIKDDIIYGDIELDPKIYLDKKNHKVSIASKADASRMKAKKSLTAKVAGKK